MKLSTRSRYGMRAVLELAVEYGKGPLQIKTIAEREGISNKYLEQLVSILKSAGIVRSIRGPKGGYVLTRPPAEITLKNVFEILEGPLVAVDCIEHPESCERCVECSTRDLWIEMQQALVDVLASKTLEDIVIKTRKCKEKPDYQI